MKKPKTTLKRRRARKGAGTPPKPAAKRKRKPKASAPAGGAHPPTPAAGARPELEKIPTRPMFDAPRHSYFLGGGVAMPAGFLPDGFVLASKPKPAEYRAAEFRSYRTFPEGEFIRCVRYELKPESVAHMREHAEQCTEKPSSDCGGVELSFIQAGTFFVLLQSDGENVISVRCPCNRNVIRVRAVGCTRCHKCGATYTARTDQVGLPIVTSRKLKDYFSCEASKLPRNRTR
jgi:hypothetical protein